MTPPKQRATQKRSAGKKARARNRRCLDCKKNDAEGFDYWCKKAQRGGRGCVTYYEKKCDCVSGVIIKRTDISGGGYNLCPVLVKKGNAALIYFKHCSNCGRKL